MSSLQYALLFEKGQTSKEEGHFFPATPFNVSVGTKTYDITLKKGSKGKVIYSVSESGSLVFELAHNDYCLDTPPQELTGDMATLFAALVKLGITFEKGYRTYFAKPEVLSLYTFSVMQERVNVISK